MDDRFSNSAVLKLNEHAVVCPKDQDSLPFWEREWIALDLKKLLFTQTDGAPLLRTYFVVDASLRAATIGTFDLDTLDVPVSCLFQGNAAEELEESAPYIIDVTLPHGVDTQWNDVPSFHKSFFANEWNKNTGIFVRTTASMDEVKAHFRKFTRMKVEADGRWLFFRFWDPRIAPSYFTSLVDMPGKVVQWCQLRGGHRITMFVGNQSDSFDAWSVEPNWDALEGCSAAGVPSLSDTEMRGLAQYRLSRYERRAFAFLSSNHPQLANALSEEQSLDVIRLSYKNAKKRGISNERDHFKYLTAAVLCGSHFERDPLFDSVICATGFDDHRYANFEMLCERVKQVRSGLYADLQSPKRILMGFERLYSAPLEDLNVRVAEDKIRKIWPKYTQSLTSHELEAFITYAGAVGFKLGLAGADLLMYVCISVYFGADLANDPQFPWAQSTLSLPDEEKRRHAFGEAVLDYFQSIVESHNE